MDYQFCVSYTTALLVFQTSLSSSHNSNKTECFQSKPGEEVLDFKKERKPEKEGYEERERERDIKHDTDKLCIMTYRYRVGEMLHLKWYYAMYLQYL